MQSASLPTAVSTITRSQLPAAGDSSTATTLTGPRERAHQLQALGPVPTTVQEVTITTGIQYHTLITSTPELEFDAPHQLPALGRVPTTVQEVTITTGIQYHPLITSTPELESDALNYSARYPVRWRNKI